MLFRKNQVRNLTVNGLDNHYQTFFKSIVQMALWIYWITEKEKTRIDWPHPTLLNISFFLHLSYGKPKKKDMEDVKGTWSYQ